jgi:hypothetical protein
MEIKPADKIREEIRILYNKNPKKWHVLVGRDSKGYSCTIFLHKNEMWILKEEPLNPYESIGCGSKLEEIDESLKPFLKNPYSFGFRPIPERYLDEILKEGISEDIIMKTLAKSPSPLGSIKSPSIVGPITLPTKPIDFVSEKQTKLNLKLTKQLDRMILKKRPELFTPYV